MKTSKNRDQSGSIETPKRNDLNISCSQSNQMSLYSRNMQVHVPGSERKTKEVKAQRKSPKVTRARIDTGLGKIFREADLEV